MTCCEGLVGWPMTCYCEFSFLHSLPAYIVVKYMSNGAKTCSFPVARWLVQELARFWLRWASDEFLATA